MKLVCQDDLEVGIKKALQLNWATYPKLSHRATTRLGVFFHYVVIIVG